MLQLKQLQGTNDLVNFENENSMNSTRMHKFCIKPEPTM